MLRGVVTSDCWAIGLNRGHSASFKQAGIVGPIPTSDEFVEGVDASFQVSGEGICSFKHAATFMQNYCKEMIVYIRLRSEGVALFEDFERTLIDISSEVPVMVTVECVPSFQSFNGQGIYRPNDIDCYLRTFEKFPIHCLFLTGSDIVENGIEFFQLQGSGGNDYGDNESFIRMERHKCLINQWLFSRSPKALHATPQVGVARSVSNCSSERKGGTTPDPERVGSDDPDVKPKKKKVESKLFPRISHYTSEMSRDGREIVLASGFNNQSTVKEIMKQLRSEFKSRGEVLNIFVPEDNETGGCLGIKQREVLEEVGEVAISLTKWGGVASPLLVSGGSGRSGHITYQMGKNDCWAAALHRAYSALLTLSGSPGRVLTRQGIIDGVDEAYQASGDGIDRLKYAISFMEKYVKEMNIYRRPRGNDASSYEDFESFTLQLLATTPVMVTVECLPSFQSFDGQVATTTEPSEINSDDPEALVKPQKPKRLKKIVDELSNRLDEMTEIVKKLKKNSDLLEEENNNTPKEKVVDHECYFESEDADFKNRRTIFVLGFDCSFPRDEIKRTLIKHFSSCGEVSRVYIPFHCDTGSPMGFAFISMGNPDKALTLNGSYLEGMRLEVTMATKRSEYYGYTNHRGCQRCGIASAKRLAKRFYDRTRIRIPLEIRLDDSEISRTPKYQQDDKKRRKKQKKELQGIIFKTKKFCD
ncbi:hypothetical protein Bca4012_006989 [Brassica carinata]